MIINKKNNFWIYIVPSNPFARTISYMGKKPTKEEYLKHWGKWVIMDSKEYLDQMAEDLDVAVELGWIPQIKYTQYPSPQLGLNKCVMCVFCDDRLRGEVLQLLSVAEIMPDGWEYERDMIKEWKPGGKFLEKFIKSKNLSGQEAATYRDEIPKQMDNYIEYIVGDGDKAVNLRRHAIANSSLIATAEDMHLLSEDSQDNWQANK